MLTSTEKQIAWAAMDDAESFELVVAAAAPEGDVVVTITRAPSLDALRPATKLARKMARTFFADKTSREPAAPAATEGPVGLYLVCVPPDLDAEHIEPLDDEAHCV